MLPERSGLLLSERVLHKQILLKNERIGSTVCTRSCGHPTLVAGRRGHPSLVATLEAGGRGHPDLGATLEVRARGHPNLDAGG